MAVSALAIHSLWLNPVGVTLIIVGLLIVLVMKLVRNR